MVPVCDRWVLLYDGRVRFVGDTAAAMETDDEVVRTFFDSGFEVGGSDVDAGDVS